MRSLLFLMLFAGVAAADCVINPGSPGSEYNPFYGNNLVVCDITVEWRHPAQPPDADLTRFLSRLAVLTWQPGIPGYLEIVGVGISFFDASGGISAPELRYGSGDYGHRQVFGGIGHGYDIDFTPDPNAPMTIDGVSTSGLIQMGWAYSLSDKTHGVWSPQSEVGARLRLIRTHIRCCPGSSRAFCVPAFGDGGAAVWF